MGFVGVLQKNFIQTASLPKISTPGQIAFEIAQLSLMHWWLHTNPTKFDSLHNIRKQVKFKMICMDQH